MSNSFDLTTKEGRAMMRVFFPIHTPVGLALAAIDGIASLVGGSNERAIEAQRKVALDIIRAGKENDADEIEITISQKAGVSLGSDVDGIPIEFIVGSSDKMTLKVKYK